MLVKELIAKLQELPEDMRIVIGVFEGGYADVTDLSDEYTLVEDYNEPEAWYYGRHESVVVAEMSPSYIADNYNKFTAVRIY